MAHSSDRSSLRVSAEMGPEAALAAAGIWAEATAARDGLSPPPSAEEKLPGIHQALAHHGAALLIAQLDDDVAGFALLVPRAHAMELLYLAVDPAA